MVHPQQAGRVGGLQGTGHGIRAAPLPDVVVGLEDERGLLEPLLIFPDPAPPILAQALDLAGYPWNSAGTLEVAAQLEPDDGWAGAIVCGDVAAAGAFALSRRLRKQAQPFQPL